MEEQITAAITKAYHDGDKIRLDAYKMFKAEMEKNKKEPKPKTDIQVLVSLIKRYEQSIELYKNALAYTLAKQETAQMEVLKGLLPQYDAREVETYIYKLIGEHQATIKDTKKIVELAQQRYPTVDGKLVSHLIKHK